MGIIGWADATNSIGEEAADEPAAVTEEPESEEIGIGEEQMPEAPAEDLTAAEPCEPLDCESGNELLDAIRSLKLKGGEDECDISKFELHEVKFLFNHAERGGFSDYYGVVREVFAVKHRILDKVDDIDEVESPNLDELLSFAEEKYERSFGGEDA